MKNITIEFTKKELFALAQSKVIMKRARRYKFGAKGITDKFREAVPKFLSEDEIAEFKKLWKESAEMPVLPKKKTPEVKIKPIEYQVRKLTITSYDPTKDTKGVWRA